MTGLTVALMTDETGWHTRQLQAALRARGCVGRCVDLADCRIDTTAAWHGLALPGFGRGLPDAALVRGIAAGVRAGHQAARRCTRCASSVCRSTTMPGRSSAASTVDDQPAAACGARPHTADLGHGIAGAGAAHCDARRRRGPHARAQTAVRLPGQRAAARRPGGRRPSRAARDRPAYGRLPAQRFVPALTSPGFDWRVLVIGGRAAAACGESARTGYNVAQGRAASRRMRLSWRNGRRRPARWAWTTPASTSCLRPTLARTRCQAYR